MGQGFWVKVPGWINRRKKLVILVWALLVSSELGPRWVGEVGELVVGSHTIFILDMKIHYLYYFHLVSFYSSIPSSVEAWDLPCGSSLQHS
jgi:hypothetical protein